MLSLETKTGWTDEEEVPPDVCNQIRVVVTNENTVLATGVVDRYKGGEISVVQNGISHLVTYHWQGLSFVQPANEFFSKSTRLRKGDVIYVSHVTLTTS